MSGEGTTNEENEHGRHMRGVTRGLESGRRKDSALEASAERGGRKWRGEARGVLGGVGPGPQPHGRLNELHSWRGPEGRPSMQLEPGDRHCFHARGASRVSQILQARRYEVRPCDRGDFVDFVASYLVPMARLGFVHYGIFLYIIYVTCSRMIVLYS